MKVFCTCIGKNGSGCGEFTLDASCHCIRVRERVIFARVSVLEVGSRKIEVGCDNQEVPRCFAREESMCRLTLMFRLGVLGFSNV